MLIIVKKSNMYYYRKVYVFVNWQEDHQWDVHNPNRCAWVGVLLTLIILKRIINQNVSFKYININVCCFCLDG